MSKFITCSKVSHIEGFNIAIAKGLVKKGASSFLMIKKGESYVKSPIENLDKVNEWLSKLSPTTDKPTATPTTSAPINTNASIKHFTPSNVDYNKSPMEQMKYSSKGIAEGIVLHNSKGQGFYLHKVSAVSNFLYREDKLSPSDRDKIIALLKYANKNFLTQEQFDKAISTLKEIYVNGSTDLCRRIIMSLWVK